MSQSRIRTAVIVGSTREGRFGGTVAKWFVSRAALHPEIDIDLIDLAEANLPAILTDAPPPEVEAVTARIAEADAFVIVTPEYNHGYPASLKFAIDSAREEWFAKPVCFVSYGGTSGGLRAVEQLRLVCAELHMVTLRDCVSLHMCHDLFDEAGVLKEPAGPNGAASTMISQLIWWAEALREQRARWPYGSPGSMKTGTADTLSPMQILERMFRVEMSYVESEAKDIAILAEAFHPDVVVHEPTSVPYPGDWKGLEGVSRLMEKMSRSFSKIEVEGLSCSGSPDKLYVSCTLHMTSRETGNTITQPFAQVLKFENGRLIEGTPFYFDTAEMQAALHDPNANALPLSQYSPT